MLALLGQLGILLTILVFAVIIGLVMGFAGLSKKVAVTMAVGYGAGIFILTFLVSRYWDTVYKVVYEYNFIIFLVMAVVIIYTGFHTIREWKIHRKNHVKASFTVMISSHLCCLGAVMTGIILVSPFIEISIATIGQYAAVLLSLAIIIFYFASEAIIRNIKKPYPVLLGNFMFFVGFYFLVSAVVIPNINTVLQSSMSPLDIPSMQTLIYTFVFVIMLVFTGFYFAKKNSNLIR
ncbi:DUF2162 domain-containing protein [Methanobacterium oryzae]|uniref:DUF2162 domain-containing protein n=1 Tax=Methanobacterium oryzae TaxID=69540 RepID=UPI003D22A5EB